MKRPTRQAAQDRLNSPLGGRLATRWLCGAGSAAGGLLLSGCAGLGLLTVNTLATFSHYTRQTDICYGPAAAERLDLYLPTRPGHHPIVLFFHGGGWNSGDKAAYKFVGAALADAGIIAVLPNYTLYPRGKYPTFMQDAARAVAFSRTQARAWGAEPEQIFLLGHSAGAHIAVMLALDPEYLQQVGGSPRWLRGVVGLSGPYDFLPFTDAYLNDLFGPPAQFPRSQPINYVRADAPPLLLMHGLRDQRVSPNNTRSLSAALQAVGARVETIYFEQAGHADLVAALSIPARKRLPVLKDIEVFITRESVATVPAVATVATLATVATVSSSRPRCTRASATVGAGSHAERMVGSRLSSGDIT